MKKLLFLIPLLFMVLIGCNKKEVAPPVTDGVFGKPLTIRAKFLADVAALRKDGMKHVNTADDMVEFNRKVIRLNEQARKDFHKEAELMKLPLDIPFVDSTNRQVMQLLSVKMIGLDFEMATFAIRARMIQPVYLNYKGRLIPKSFMAYMADGKGKPVTPGRYDWLRGSYDKQFEIGDTVEFLSTVPDYHNYPALKQFIFRY